MHVRTLVVGGRLRPAGYRREGPARCFNRAFAYQVTIFRTPGPSLHQDFQCRSLVRLKSFYRLKSLTSSCCCGSIQDKIGLTKNHLRTLSDRRALSEANFYPINGKKGQTKKTWTGALASSSSSCKSAWKLPLFLEAAATKQLVHRHVCWKHF